MAFSPINCDQKQHLNLSEEAWLILEQDRAAFGWETPTGFLNHILLRYCRTAEASLFLTRQRKRLEYREHLKELPEEYRDLAAGILADRDIGVIQDRLKTYPKGHGLKFRLCNELVAYLTEKSVKKNRAGECREDACYGNHTGRYLKALLEEYARLPYLQRERICYAEYFSTLELCIAGKRQVKLRVSSGSEFLVRPFRIMTDAQSTYHYLIAWSDRDERPFSYRISSLQSVSQTSQGGSLTLEKKERIIRALQQNDVPYIADTPQEVRVRLTPGGIRKYQTILHLRPQYSRVEPENVYVFCCTLRQAEHYFSKFGPDATVLSPRKLADRLRRFHLRALESYPRPQ